MLWFVEAEFLGPLSGNYKIWSPSGSASAAAHGRNRMCVCVLPDSPFGGDVGNVEIVDTAPLDVGQVANDLCLVVGRVEYTVEVFRNSLLFCGGDGAGQIVSTRFSSLERNCR